MRHIFVWKLVMLGSMAIVCQQATAATREVGLVITNTRVEAIGVAGSEIGVGSPIWITLSLKNTNLEPVTFWLDQSENSGISIKPNNDNRGKVETVSRNTPLERSFRVTILKPGEEKELDVFLGDFLRIVDVGNFRIRCILQIKDGDRKPIALEASIPLQVSRRLDRNQEDQILRVLRERFHSENPAERLKAVKSARGIDTTEATAFLEKAFQDDDESVQLAAIEDISHVKNNDVTAALEKAQLSKCASVQRAAKSEILRRTK